MWTVLPDHFMPKRQTTSYAGWYVPPMLELHLDLPAGPGRRAAIETALRDAIRTGRKPNADVGTAHLSVALVHLGNLACRLGRSLRVDPKAETIVGDDEAKAMLTRRYRKGGHWGVPKGV